MEGEEEELPPEIRKFIQKANKKVAKKEVRGAILSSLSNAACEGWMLKIGSIKASTWKRRYYVLKEKKLFYYDKKGMDTRARGVIFLDRNHRVEVLDDRELMKKLKKSLTLFKLIHTAQKEYTFCSRSEEDLQRWVNAIIVEICREFIVHIAKAESLSRSARRPTWIDLDPITEIPDSSVSGRKFCDGGEGCNSKDPRHFVDYQHTKQRVETAREQEKEAKGKEKEKEKERSEAEKRELKEKEKKEREEQKEKEKRDRKLAKEKEEKEKREAKEREEKEKREAKEREKAKPAELKAIKRGSTRKIASRYEAEVSAINSGGKKEEEEKRKRKEEKKKKKEELAKAKEAEREKKEKEREERERLEKEKEQKEKERERKEREKEQKEKERNAKKPVQTNVTSPGSPSQNRSHPRAVTQTPIEIPKIKELVRRFEEFESQLKGLTEEELQSSKGQHLKEAAGVLKDSIVRKSRKFPAETAGLVSRYNSLSRELPARIQSSNSDFYKEREALQKGIACHKCGGRVVGEACKMTTFFFHPKCFACTTCNRSLQTAPSCICVQDKPYCDACGAALLLPNQRQKD